MNQKSALLYLQAMNLQTFLGRKLMLLGEQVKIASVFLHRVEQISRSAPQGVEVEAFPSLVIRHGGDNAGSHGAD